MVAKTSREIRQKQLSLKLRNKFQTIIAGAAPFKQFVYLITMLVCYSAPTVSNTLCGKKGVKTFVKSKPFEYKHDSNFNRKYHSLYHSLQRVLSQKTFLI